MNTLTTKTNIGTLEARSLGHSVFFLCFSDASFQLNRDGNLQYLIFWSKTIQKNFELPTALLARLISLKGLWFRSKLLDNAALVCPAFYLKTFNGPTLAQNRIWK